MESKAFIEALTAHDLEAICKIPKADLHNHFVLGGSRKFIKDITGYEINALNSPIYSMEEMEEWSRQYIAARFNSYTGRKLLIEATFKQAADDGVKILEIGEDVWGLGEFFDGDISKLIATFEEANEKYAPETELKNPVVSVQNSLMTYGRKAYKENRPNTFNSLPIFSEGNFFTVPHAYA